MREFSCFDNSRKLPVDSETRLGLVTASHTSVAPSALPDYAMMHYLHVDVGGPLLPGMIR